MEDKEKKLRDDLKEAVKDYCRARNAHAWLTAVCIIGLVTDAIAIGWWQGDTWVLSGMLVALLLLTAWSIYGLVDSAESAAMGKALFVSQSMRFVLHPDGRVDVRHEEPKDKDDRDREEDSDGT